MSQSEQDSDVEMSARDERVSPGPDSDTENASMGLGGESSSRSKHRLVRIATKTRKPKKWVIFVGIKDFRIEPSATVGDLKRMVEEQGTVVGDQFFFTDGPDGKRLDDARRLDSYDKMNDEPTLILRPKTYRPAPAIVSPREGEAVREENPEIKELFGLSESDLLRLGTRSSIAQEAPVQDLDEEAPRSKRNASTPADQMKRDRPVWPMYESSMPASTTRDCPETMRTLAFASVTSDHVRAEYVSSFKHWLLNWHTSDLLGETDSVLTPLVDMALDQVFGAVDPETKFRVPALVDGAEAGEGEGDRDRNRHLQDPLSLAYAPRLSKQNLSLPKLAWDRLQNVFVAIAKHLGDFDKVFEAFWITAQNVDLAAAMYNTAADRAMVRLLGIASEMSDAVGKSAQLARVREMLRGQSGHDVAVKELVELMQTDLKQINQLARAFDDNAAELKGQEPAVVPRRHLSEQERKQALDEIGVLHALVSFAPMASEVTQRVQDNMNRCLAHGSHTTFETVLFRRHAQMSGVVSSPLEVGSMIAALTTASTVQEQRRGAVARRFDLGIPPAFVDRAVLYSVKLTAAVVGDSRKRTVSLAVRQNDTALDVIKRLRAAHSINVRVEDNLCLLRADGYVFGPNQVLGKIDEPLTLWYSAVYMRSTETLEAKALEFGISFDIKAEIKATKAVEAKEAKGEAKGDTKEAEEEAKAEDEKEAEDEEQDSDSDIEPEEVSDSELQEEMAAARAKAPAPSPERIKWERIIKRSKKHIIKAIADAASVPDAAASAQEQLRTLSDKMAASRAWLDSDRVVHAAVVIASELKLAAHGSIRLENADLFAHSMAWHPLLHQWFVRLFTSQATLAVRPTAAALASPKFVYDYFGDRNLRLSDVFASPETRSDRAQAASDWIDSRLFDLMDAVVAGDMDMKIDTSATDFDARRLIARLLDKMPVPDMTSTALEHFRDLCGAYKLKTETGTLDQQALQARLSQLCIAASRHVLVSGAQTTLFHLLRRRAVSVEQRICSERLRDAVSAVTPIPCERQLPTSLERDAILEAVGREDSDVARIIGECVADIYLGGHDAKTSFVSVSDFVAKDDSDSVMREGRGQRVSRLRYVKGTQPHIIALDFRSSGKIVAVAVDRWGGRPTKTSAWTVVDLSLDKAGSSIVAAEDMITLLRLLQLARFAIKWRAASFVVDSLFRPHATTVINAMSRFGLVRRRSPAGPITIQGQKRLVTQDDIKNLDVRRMAIEAEIKRLSVDGDDDADEESAALASDADDLAVLKYAQSILTQLKRALASVSEDKFLPIQEAQRFTSLHGASSAGDAKELAAIGDELKRVTESKTAFDYAVLDPPQESESLMDQLDELLGLFADEIKSEQVREESELREATQDLIKQARVLLKATLNLVRPGEGVLVQINEALESANKLIEQGAPSAAPTTAQFLQLFGHVPSIVRTDVTAVIDDIHALETALNKDALSAKRKQSRADRTKAKLAALNSDLAKNTVELARLLRAMGVKEQVSFDQVIQQFIESDSQDPYLSAASSDLMRALESQQSRLHVARSELKSGPEANLIDSQIKRVDLVFRNLVSVCYRDLGAWSSNIYTVDPSFALALTKADLDASDDVASGTVVESRKAKPVQPAKDGRRSDIEIGLVEFDQERYDNDRVSGAVLFAQHLVRTALMPHALACKLYATEFWRDGDEYQGSAFASSLMRLPLSPRMQWLRKNLGDSEARTLQRSLEFVLRQHSALHGVDIDALYDSDDVEQIVSLAEHVLALAPSMGPQTAAAVHRFILRPTPSSAPVWKPARVLQTRESLLTASGFQALWAQRKRIHQEHMDLFRAKYQQPTSSMTLNRYLELTKEDLQATIANIKTHIAALKAAAEKAAAENRVMSEQQQLHLEALKQELAELQGSASPDQGDKKGGDNDGDVEMKSTAVRAESKKIGKRHGIMWEYAQWPRHLAVLHLEQSPVTALQVTTAGVMEFGAFENVAPFLYIGSLQHGGLDVVRPLFAQEALARASKNRANQVAVAQSIGPILESGDAVRYMTHRDVVSAVLGKPSRAASGAPAPSRQVSPRADVDEGAHDSDADADAREEDEEDDAKNASPAAAAAPKLPDTMTRSVQIALESGFRTLFDTVRVRATDIPVFVQLLIGLADPASKTDGSWAFQYQFDLDTGRSRPSQLELMDRETFEQGWSEPHRKAHLAIVAENFSLQPDAISVDTIPFQIDAANASWLLRTFRIDSSAQTYLGSLVEASTFTKARFGGLVGADRFAIEQILDEFSATARAHFQNGSVSALERSIVRPTATFELIDTETRSMAATVHPKPWMVGRVDPVAAARRRQNALRVIEADSKAGQLFMHWWTRVTPEDRTISLADMSRMEQSWLRDKIESALESLSTLSDPSQVMLSRTSRISNLLADVRALPGGKSDKAIKALQFAADKIDPSHWLAHMAKDDIVAAVAIQRSIEMDTETKEILAGKIVKLLEAKLAALEERLETKLDAKYVDVQDSVRFKVSRNSVGGRRPRSVAAADEATEDGKDAGGDDADEGGAAGSAGAGEGADADSTGDDSNRAGNRGMVLAQLIRDLVAIDDGKGKRKTNKQVEEDLKEHVKGLRKAQSDAQQKFNGTSVDLVDDEGKSVRGRTKFGNGAIKALEAKIKEIKKAFNIGQGAASLPLAMQQDDATEISKLQARLSALVLGQDRLVTLAKSAQNQFEVDLALFKRDRFERKAGGKKHTDIQTKMGNAQRDFADGADLALIKFNPAIATVFSNAERDKRLPAMAWCMSLLHAHLFFEYADRLGICDGESRDDERLSLWRDQIRTHVKTLSAALGLKKDIKLLQRQFAPYELGSRLPEARTGKEAKDDVDDDDDDTIQGQLRRARTHVKDNIARLTEMLLAVPETQGVHKWTPEGLDALGREFESLTENSKTLVDLRKKRNERIASAKNMSETATVKEMVAAIEKKIAGASAKPPAAPVETKQLAGGTASSTTAQLSNLLVKAVLLGKYAVDLPDMGEVVRHFVHAFKALLDPTGDTTTLPQATQLMHAARSAVLTWRTSKVKRQAALERAVQAALDIRMRQNAVSTASATQSTLNKSLRDKRSTIREAASRELVEAQKAAAVASDEFKAAVHDLENSEERQKSLRQEFRSQQGDVQESDMQNVMREVQMAKSRRDIAAAAKRDADTRVARLTKLSASPATDAILQTKADELQAEYKSLRDTIIRTRKDLSVYRRQAVIRSKGAGAGAGTATPKDAADLEGASAANQRAREKLAEVLVQMHDMGIEVTEHGDKSDDEEENESKLKTTKESKRDPDRLVRIRSSEVDELGSDDDVNDVNDAVLSEAEEDQEQDEVEQEADAGAHDSDAEVGDREAAPDWDNPDDEPVVPPSEVEYHVDPVAPAAKPAGPSASKDIGRTIKEIRKRTAPIKKSAVAAMKRKYGISTIKEALAAVANDQATIDKMNGDLAFAKARFQEANQALKAVRAGAIGHLRDSIKKITIEIAEAQTDLKRRKQEHERLLRYIGKKDDGDGNLVALVDNRDLTVTTDGLLVRDDTNQVDLLLTMEHAVNLYAPLTVASKWSEAFGNLRLAASDPRISSLRLRDFAEDNASMNILTGTVDILNRFCFTLPEMKDMVIPEITNDNETAMCLKLLALQRRARMSARLNALASFLQSALDVPIETVGGVFDAKTLEKTAVTAPAWTPFSGDGDVLRLDAVPKLYGSQQSVNRRLEELAAMMNEDKKETVIDAARQSDYRRVIRGLVQCLHGIFTTHGTRGASMLSEIDRVLVSVREQVSTKYQRATSAVLSDAAAGAGAGDADGKDTVAMAAAIDTLRKAVRVVVAKIKDMLATVQTAIDKSATDLRPVGSAAEIAKPVLEAAKAIQDLVGALGKQLSDVAAKWPVPGPAEAIAKCVVSANEYDASYVFTSFLSESKSLVSPGIAHFLHALSGFRAIHRQLMDRQHLDLYVARFIVAAKTVRSLHLIANEKGVQAMDETGDDDGEGETKQEKKQDGGDGSKIERRHILISEATEAGAEAAKVSELDVSEALRMLPVPWIASSKTPLDAKSRDAEIKRILDAPVASVPDVDALASVVRVSPATNDQLLLLAIDRALRAATNPANHTVNERQFDGVEKKRRLKQRLLQDAKETKDADAAVRLRQQAADLQVQIKAEEDKEIDAKNAASQKRTKLVDEFRELGHKIVAIKDLKSPERQKLVRQRDALSAKITKATTEYNRVQQQALVAGNIVVSLGDREFSDSERKRLDPGGLDGTTTTLLDRLCAPQKFGQDLWDTFLQPIGEDAEDRNWAADVPVEAIEVALRLLRQRVILHQDAWRADLNRTKTAADVAHAQAVGQSLTKSTVAAADIVSRFLHTEVRACVSGVANSLTFAKETMLRIHDHVQSGSIKDQAFASMFQTWQKWFKEAVDAKATVDSDADTAERKRADMRGVIGRDSERVESLLVKEAHNCDVRLRARSNDYMQACKTLIKQLDNAMAETIERLFWNSVGQTQADDKGRRRAIPETDSASFELLLQNVQVPRVSAVRQIHAVALAADKTRSALKMLETLVSSVMANAANRTGTLRDARPVNLSVALEVLRKVPYLYADQERALTVATALYQGGSPALPVAAASAAAPAASIARSLGGLGTKALGSAQTIGDILARQMDPTRTDAQVAAVVIEERTKAAQESKVEASPQMQLETEYKNAIQSVVLDRGLFATSLSASRVFCDLVLDSVASPAVLVLDGAKIGSPEVPLSFVPDDRRAVDRYTLQSDASIEFVVGQDFVRTLGTEHRAHRILAIHVARGGDAAAAAAALVFRNYHAEGAPQIETVLIDPRTTLPLVPAHVVPRGYRLVFAANGAVTGGPWIDRAKIAGVLRRTQAQPSSLPEVMVVMRRSRIGSIDIPLGTQYSAASSAVSERRAHYFEKIAFEIDDDTPIVADEIKFPEASKLDRDIKTTDTLFVRDRPGSALVGFRGAKHLVDDRLQLLRTAYSSFFSHAPFVTFVGLPSAAPETKVNDSLLSFVRGIARSYRIPVATKATVPAGLLGQGVTSVDDINDLTPTHVASTFLVAFAPAHRRTIVAVETKGRRMIAPGDRVATLFTVIGNQQVSRVAPRLADVIAVPIYLDWNGLSYLLPRAKELSSGFASINDLAVDLNRKLFVSL